MLRILVAGDNLPPATLFEAMSPITGCPACLKHGLGCGAKAD
jgi:hypothetical protein